MAIQKREKLNYLLRGWPSGTVTAQSWLESQGISRQLSGFYVKAGWIQKIGQGAFIKAGDKVDWMGGLYAVQQQLGFKVHLGGKSLLEIIGASHFVPMGSKKSLCIYADVEDEKKPLPKWFVLGFKEIATITYVSRGLFSKRVGIELWEQPNFSIAVSTRERALMEVLALVPQGVSYSQAYLLFQGKDTLRPSLIQLLLECCVSYKVKRLFLHLAKKCGLSWASYLNLERVNLGQGKRQIGEGGQYDRDYKISVPKLGEWDEPGIDIEV